jgi:hypothetical protein
MATRKRPLAEPTAIRAALASAIHAVDASNAALSAARETLAAAMLELEAMTNLVRAAESGSPESVDQARAAHGGLKGKTIADLTDDSLDAIGKAAGRRAFRDARRAGVPTPVLRGDELEYIAD